MTETQLPDEPGVITQAEAEGSQSVSRRPPTAVSSICP